MFNFAGEERRVVLANPDRSARWRRQLSTDEERYGGRGMLPAVELAGGDLAVAMPATSAALYTEDLDP